MHLKTQYIHDTEGKRIAVVLDLSFYNQIMEDLRDLKIIAERRREPSISLLQFEARLKKHGVL